MIDFITHLSQQSAKQRALGWNSSQTIAPSWMVAPLSKSPGIVPKGRAYAMSAIAFKENPLGQTHNWQWIQIIGASVLVLCILCCLLAAACTFHVFYMRKFS